MSKKYKLAFENETLKVVKKKCNSVSSSWGPMIKSYKCGRMKGHKGWHKCRAGSWQVVWL